MFHAYSGIFSVTFLVTFIEEYLPTFEYVPVYSGIFRILALPVQIV